MLEQLSMETVREHYLRRKKVRDAMLKTLQSGNAKAFADLALGITDPAGNYSAAEHHLGLKILQHNGPEAVLLLGKALAAAPAPKKVPDLIAAQNIKYLKVSVGSEISMMLDPEKYWTANVRTVWAHLLIMHNDDYAAANAALNAYRAADAESEMAYNLWAAIHPELRPTLTRLHDAGVSEAAKQGVTPGKLRFLWADVIADALYCTRS